MTVSWWNRIKEYVRHLDEGYADEETGKPTRKWNDLLIRLAREIERVMRSEMFEPPGEPTYIPPEYIVFLSPTDDAALQGDKRIGFLKGLRNMTAERARQIVGPGGTQTDKICVEFRVDSSLPEDEFYVKGCWDAHPDPTTIRIPRSGQEGPLRDGETRMGADDELTEVRRHPLFRLDVVREHEPHPMSYPIYKPEIRLGRGGRDTPVDVALAEDREISRLHAIMRKTDAGYEIITRGRNPIVVNQIEVESGGSAMVSPGDPIHIGAYVLRIVDPGSQQEER